MHLPIRLIHQLISFRTVSPTLRTKEINNIIGFFRGRESMTRLSDKTNTRHIIKYEF